MIMNDPIILPDSLRSLWNLFDPPDTVGNFEIIDGDRVPPPYHRLLVHQHHMTIAMEEHHGEPVDVRVVATRRTDSSYARRSLLTLRATGRIVQHCSVQIDLNKCSPAVRDEILSESAPLGAILIRHRVMRRIVPGAYLKIRGAAGIMEAFNVPAQTVCYGRMATIHCDGSPAIEALEIVAPERTLTTR